MMPMPSSRSSFMQPSDRSDFSIGAVVDVTGTLATVQLVSGQQIKARTDLMYGRSAPAQEGEHWMMSRQFGNWRFMAFVGLAPPVLQRYAITLGDGTKSAWHVVHSLGTTDVLVNVYNPIIGTDPPAYTLARLDENTILISFSSPPATGSIRVVVVG